MVLKRLSIAQTVVFVRMELLSRMLPYQIALDALRMVNLCHLVGATLVQMVGW